MKKDKRQEKASEIHCYRDLDSQKELSSCEQETPPSLRRRFRQRCFRPVYEDARFVSTSSKDEPLAHKRK